MGKFVVQYIEGPADEEKRGGKIRFFHLTHKTGGKEKRMGKRVPEIRAGLWKAGKASY